MGRKRPGVLRAPTRTTFKTQPVTDVPVTLGVSAPQLPAGRWRRAQRLPPGLLGGALGQGPVSQVLPPMTLTCSLPTS